MLSRLQRSRTQSTRYLAIGGGKDFPTNEEARGGWVSGVAEKAGVSAERTAQLLGRYGTTAAALLSASSAYGDERRLSGAPDYSFHEIDWITRNEMVVHLSDIVLRRTTIAIEGRLTLEGLREIANIAGTALAWDAERTASEIDDVVTQLDRFHGQTLTGRKKSPELGTVSASAVE
ncbi:hypothetical protein N7E02_14275 [Aliirhizobium terrae]|nr:glycerol-3-phosphate dehydrogenase C-terminal domain-containing protein [Rhizobium sp. CC-CFT758]WJH42187.1 hypothetical protein N7E02_14275 [Rhizobium sp. CC-CFT758]